MKIFALYLKKINESVFCNLKTVKIVLAFLLLVAAAANASAQGAVSTSVNRKLVEEVTNRLLQYTSLPYKTQQPLLIVDEADFQKINNYPFQINAFATEVRLGELRSRGYVLTKEQTKGMVDSDPFPVVAVYPSALDKYIKGDKDKLAFLLGHELNHLVKDHVKVEVPRAISREQEKEADFEGIKVAIKAGYSKNKMLEFANNFFVDEDPNFYSGLFVFWNRFSRNYEIDKYQLKAIYESPNVVNRYVLSKLSEQTKTSIRTCLSSCSVADSKLFLSNLSKELNQILSQTDFYNDDRFNGVSFSQRTNELRAKTTRTREETVLFNRLLMEDAIPEILKFSGYYTSIEGQLYTHPDSANRVAIIAHLTGNKPDYWRATGAFHNGVKFLEFGAYDAANLSFRRVLEDYPDSYDAYSNLGYSLLMQYVEKLSSENIQDLGIGHLAGGAFYSRARIRDKGFDNALWRQAVEALEKAIQLNPESSVAKANLGMAYLLVEANLNPGEEKRANLAKSYAYFQEAINLFAKDPLSSSAQAAVYNNAGVAALALNKIPEAKNYFAKVDKTSVQSLYNTALVIEKEQGDRQLLKQTLASFLERTPDASKYRQIAQIKYRNLGGTDIPAKPDNLGQVVGAKFGERVIALSEPLKADARTTMGCVEKDIFGRQEYQIKSYLCANFNAELILAGDEVLSIRLLKENPATEVTLKGSSGVDAVTFPVKIGLRTQDVLSRFAGNYSEKGFWFESDNDFITEITIARVPLN